MKKILFISAILMQFVGAVPQPTRNLWDPTHQKQLAQYITPEKQNCIKSLRAFHKENLETLVNKVLQHNNQYPNQIITADDIRNEANLEKNTYIAEKLQDIANAIQ